MSPLFRLAASVAVAVVLATRGNAQEAQDPPQSLRYRLDYVRIDNVPREDYGEMRVFGGFTFSVPGLGVAIRGTNALILTDVEARALLDESSSSGLPRRGIEPPASRRRLSASEVRARIERTMRTFGQEQPPSNQSTAESPNAERASADRALDLVRFLYFEGGILVVRNGVEMLRCERLWISPLEDRVVAEEVELRYTSRSAEGQTTVIVRGPRLIKSGSRWTGRDLTITTCTAAEPHIAVAVGEAEIIERPGELEIFARGQTLQLGGTEVMPLPDAHFFTNSQNQFPIKSASIGYSAKEGIEADIVLGLPWNTTGGAIHNWLTGRPAQEFRGDWELGIGFIEDRGVPLQPAIDYGVPGLYTGRTEAFVLNDSGTNLREIRTNLDGSPITDTDRSMLRTENRFYLGTNTHLDVQAYTASDPAVLSEFYPGDYRNTKLPETSAYLHHQTSNHLLTFSTRANLDDFSYRDNRSLSPRFIEELPVVTWNLLAQTIGETPWETPIVLDVASELGQRRSDFNAGATVRTPDQTLRVDNDVELSTPFTFGVINIRPFISTRGTLYDNTVAGGSEQRIAFEGGVQLGTRMSRVFQWTSDEGSSGVRHILSPRFTFRNRFYVDDAPTDFYQFDATDALSEQQLVRFEVRNLLQDSEAADEAAPRDFLMLDLAQDLWPDKTRDNNGETLGLFYYDLRVRPQGHWVPFPTFSFAFYGDHDWNNGLRTLDTELRFGPLAGLTWTLEYRTDAFVDGAVGLSANTRIYDRWLLFANSLFDLNEDDWKTYGFGLQRRDHDWSIAMTGNYNPFSDETTFRLEFIPTLPGLSRASDSQYGRTYLQNAGFAALY